MARRVFALGTSVVGLAVAAVLVMGLAAPVSALAGKHKPIKPHAPRLVLQVLYNGTPVKAYSLGQLWALPSFAGDAGFRKITGTIVGPDAVTGVRVTDIVADALGTPLTAAESVNVADVSADPYHATFSYDQLVNLTGFTMYDATTGNPVAISSLKGPLAAVLIYSDPLRNVMPNSSGPLRFVIADATSENAVMESSPSVYHTNQLNVINPGAAGQNALSARDNRSVTAHSCGGK